MTRTTTIRFFTAGLAVAATAGLIGCAADDTPTAEAAADQPTSIDTVAGTVTLPDGAWAAAEVAAHECEAVSPELIAGTIVTLSGYDAEYSDASGRAGYAAAAPEQWKQWGTGSLDDRTDLAAATEAIGTQLCSGFDTATTLVDDPADDFDVESHALAVVLMGEKYVEREGIAPMGDVHDPHLVRTQVSDIQHAAASVATT